MFPFGGITLLPPTTHSTPCLQVVDVSTSKTGKHGHAKCAFVAVDIFTGKKMEDLSPSSHNVDVPHVSRTDYTLLDITDDGFVSLMNEAGDTKDDLQVGRQWVVGKVMEKFGCLRGACWVAGVAEWQRGLEVAYFGSRRVF